MDAIYLDHAATTPLHPQVIEAMVPLMQTHYGNPSSLHTFGRTARHYLNDARDRLAEMLNCQSNELIFTSGGTESINLAIVGAVRAQGGSGHIITSQVEHHAVLETCRTLEQSGYEVTYLPVDEHGLIAVDTLLAALRPDTMLITIQYGNNEVGTVQPIVEIGHIARERGIVFHVDAVQALGVLAVNLAQLPIDLMSFSAHKINGPKGVGLLYAAVNTKLMPIMSGGVQERKRRAGTENVAGAVGFAVALKLAQQSREQMLQHFSTLRQSMLDQWTSLGEQIVINGHSIHKLPHILNVSFLPVSTETMLMNLDLAGIAVSSGSACNSGSIERSHVIEAMQLEEKIADSAIRFSFGASNTVEEVVKAAQAAASIVNRLT